MIKIKKSQTADTRTCDFTKVDKETLLKSSEQHIEDVRQGFNFFQEKMYEAAKFHDHTKISEIDLFHKDFITGFKTQDWYMLHKQTERHHINYPEGLKEDVNLIDILEHIIDCVMAGKARNGDGKLWDITTSNEILQKAFSNTVKLLTNNVEVEKQANE